MVERGGNHSGSEVLVGVVSDTHDLIEPRLLWLFAGVDVILHAGDVCGPAVLKALRKLAPVRAVRGNNDRGAFARKLDRFRVDEWLGVRVLTTHTIGKPDALSPAARRLLERHAPNIVVSGHSHRGNLAFKEGLFFVNPGSAGPRRFKLIRTAAIVTLTAARVRAVLHSLEDDHLSPVSALELGRERALPSALPSS